MKQEEMKDVLNKTHLSIDDLIFIAEMDYTDFSDDTINLMYSTLERVLERDGLEYSEYDEEYPNNTYLYGYELDGIIFKMYYTGIAGNYWGNTIAESVIDCRNYQHLNPSHPSQKNDIDFIDFIYEEEE